MKAMNSEITIGDYIFDNCHAVEVTSTWQRLGDTATIELPNIEGRLASLLKPGDPVEVKLGYDGLLTTEFSGYVVRVHPTMPVRVECLDEAWKLRQQTISMSWKSVTLREVLSYIAPDALLDQVPEMTLAPFRLDEVSRSEALEGINEVYGLAVYFRGPELYCGLPYAQQGIAEEHYHFQLNCLMGDLAYRRKEDVKVKVKAVSLMPDNTRLEVPLGDPDGELHTLTFYNLQEGELRQQAEEQMKRLRFDGYTGSFTGFGQPNPVHGAVVHLYDDVYPARAGSYYIDKVVTSYSPGGFRRAITLGPSAANSTAA